MTSTMLPPTTGPVGPADAAGGPPSDVVEAASGGDAAPRPGGFSGAATEPYVTTAAVVRVLGQVRALLASVAGAPFWQLPVPELDAAATATRSALVAAADERGLQALTGWQVRLARNGYPEVIPPPSLDPTRTPRQHHRFHDLPART